jgi:alkyldihydroxyacetonephosphate synthase
MEPVQTRWNGWGMPGHDDPLAANELAWRWLAQAFAMPALLATPPRDLADITLPPSRLNSSTQEKLIALLGASGVQLNAFDRARHAAGRSLQDLLRLRTGDLAMAPDAVLYPRNEADILAVLNLCAETDIAVTPFAGGTGDIALARAAHSAVVALNLSDLSRVTMLDTMSGLAEAGAGITGPALERQLAASGMMLGHRPDSFEFSTLGGWIAQPSAGQESPRSGDVSDWLRGLRVATPRGLMIPAGLPDLKHLMLGSRGAFGVITSATIRIRALPAKEEHRAYLFPDFAGGLAAIREAQRRRLPHSLLRLSDDGQTRMVRALQRTGRDRNIAEHLRDIYLSIRRIDSSAAELLAGFSGSDREVSLARKQFDRLAQRLGAVALGEDSKWSEQRFAAGYRRDTLLDRGVGMDRLELSSSWAKMPPLYVAVRAALKQAMRIHVPRPGAHGLVMCQVSPSRSDGAVLTFTWLFPRILDDAITQAQNIRRAALAAAQDYGMETIERDVVRGIRQCLDPKGILNPGILIP